MINDTNIAWAAGLFEGEGSLHLKKVPSSRHTGERLYAALSLGSTDEDVVQRFHAIVGVGAIHKDRKLTRGGKEFWHWMAAKRGDMEHVAALFRPYLGSRRLTRMEEILTEGHQVIECKCDYCGRSFTPERLHRLELPFYCGTKCRNKDRQYVRESDLVVKEYAHG